MKLSMRKFKFPVGVLLVTTTYIVSTTSMAVQPNEQPSATEDKSIGESALTTQASAIEHPQQTVAESVQSTDAAVKPLTQSEIREGLNRMQKWMIASIDEWGKTLKAEDFERTWTGGRQLIKPKRQEVCGIYQRIVNETYKLAMDNKLRLSEKDQQVLKDRTSFIQSLGYKNNVVDTKMGFNCRIK